MQPGSYTALITPFDQNGIAVDGLEKLVSFQIENGITGILAVGTTGESPTLDWDEHIRIIDIVAKQTQNRCICIAGTGSNNTAETLEATKHAVKSGCEAVLLVDPYYNGPSSMEIRREYAEPVAAEYPETTVIPYIVPGRTGAQMFPEDLGLLFKNHPNANCVKEATASLENMRRTRACCGEKYLILSGDDGITYDMMTDPDIRGGGVISVISNIFPGPVSEMVKQALDGKTDAARKIFEDLKPLFDLVTVKTTEKTPFGEVTCRSRNPVPVKTLMQVLAMPSGPCRRPLGKMSRAGIQTLLDAARKVYASAPEAFGPVADFFGVNIEKRLNDPKYTEGLVYEEY
ncbi:MAG: 4-hydroxy-tetrahydrodipicolinate synthase [Desulfobacteraceae bacterium]|nr:4-hydroxy-tetrahydrodipicolinate synthase [Desulfobacteraceae bacterium]